MSGFPERKEALDDFFAYWKPNRRTELIPLAEAAGRITAQTICSANTLPVYRESCFDGIAVRSSDFEKGMPDYTSWKLGEDFVRADTGDDFDDRYDAIIMIEEVDMDDERITYISPDLNIRKGSNVRPRGDSLKEGELLIEANLPIRPVDLSCLAMGGIKMVPVVKKPKVAFLPTGSELVPYQNTPGRGQNVDSNSLLVEAALREMGAEPLLFPICPDNKDLLEEMLDVAVKRCDMVILNAGTAKGEEDFNYGLLSRKGQLIHHYIAAAPGRPMALAVIGGKPVVNMPGPAMAAFFGCEWCINRCVARLLGIPARRRDTVRAVLMDEIHTSENMAILIRLDVYEGENGYECYCKPFRETTIPASMSSNAMYISDVGEECVPIGTVIEVELLRGREYIPKICVH